MRKMTRRELVRVSAVGAMATGLGLGGTLGLATSAQAHRPRRRGTTIHIHGRLAHPEFGEIDVSVTVDGPKDDLSGAGWDVGFPFDDSGACYFTQAGRVRGNSVHVTGRVLFANDSANAEAEVTTDANLKTGFISLNFGGAVFEGTGTVTRESDDD